MDDGVKGVRRLLALLLGLGGAVRHLEDGVEQLWEVCCFELDSVVEGEEASQEEVAQPEDQNQVEAQVREELVG